jgi:hypothetical protein
MFLILAGLGVLLIPKLRAVGLALVVLGGSLVSTVTTAAYLFPYMLDDPGLRPLVQGWVVRVHFREGTSTEQENLFLCQFVYSDCSSTGNSFPAEIISITRTGFSELTIATTTPEFQQRLLQEVRGASIVDRAAAEGFVGGN